MHWFKRYSLPLLASEINFFVSFAESVGLDVGAPDGDFVGAADGILVLVL